MANTKSAAKRARQAIVRRNHNRSVNAGVKTAVRKLREAIEKKDLAALDAELKKTTQVLDKAAGSGIIKKANASRRVSRLAAAVFAAKKAPIATT